VIALGDFGMNNEKVVSQLTSNLRDDNAKVRAATAETIAKLGINDYKKVIVPLIKACSDKEPEVRLASVSALGQLAVQTDDVMLVLLKAQEDPIPEIKIAASEALNGITQNVNH
jgi:HEAT repeat protein